MQYCAYCAVPPSHSESCNPWHSWSCIPVHCKMVGLPRGAGRGLLPALWPPTRTLPGGIPRTRPGLHSGIAVWGPVAHGTGRLQILTSCREALNLGQLLGVLTCPMRRRHRSFHPDSVTHDDSGSLGSSPCTHRVPLAENMASWFKAGRASRTGLGYMCARLENREHK